jgi:hypothetical protein
MPAYAIFRLLHLKKGGMDKKKNQVKKSTLTPISVIELKMGHKRAAVAS